MGLGGRGLAAALVLLLEGCAALPGFTPDTGARTTFVPTPPPAAFHLEGRVAVRHGEESFSGGLAWKRMGRFEELLLNTPLGQGVAEIRSDPDGVALTDAKGQTLRAADPDTLARQALGLELPLRGLGWWVVGQPRPDTPYRAEPDADGRLAVLEQDDWRIEFSRYAPQGERPLPGKLLARRGDALEVRLVVDRWELP
ncbi:MAG: lipoprotein insertase outer membrane protein LolB [Pseudomonadota bacterium]